MAVKPAELELNGLWNGNTTTRHVISQFMDFWSPGELIASEIVLCVGSDDSTNIHMSGRLDVYEK